MSQARATTRNVAIRTKHVLKSIPLNHTQADYRPNKRARLAKTRTRQKNTNIIFKIYAAETAYYMIILHVQILLGQSQYRASAKKSIWRH